MTLTIDQIRGIILEALQETQRLGGHEWVPPPEQQPVIGQLEGFDSLTGIEVTVMVEEKLSAPLGRQLSLGDSLFVDPLCKTARTLAEVVSATFEALQ